MFKLVTEIVAPWPVLVDVVREDGSVGRQEFTAQFVRVAESVFNELFAPLDPLVGEDLAAHNLAMVSRIMRGWDGVQGVDGEALAFTEANIRQLLDFPNMGAAIGKAYVRFHRAQPEVREKNSGPSPAGTPAATVPAAAAENGAKG